MIEVSIGDFEARVSCVPVLACVCVCVCVLGDRWGGVAGSLLQAHDRGIPSVAAFLESELFRQVAMRVLCQQLFCVMTLPLSPALAPCLHLQHRFRVQGGLTVRDF